MTDANQRDPRPSSTHGSSTHGSSTHGSSTHGSRRGLLTGAGGLLALAGSTSGAPAAEWPAPGTASDHKRIPN